MATSWQDIFLFVENHGIAIVLVVVGLMFIKEFWGVIKSPIKKMFDAISIDTRVKDQHAEYKKHYLAAMKYNTEITAQITMLIKHLGCDRIGIFQFHNGGAGLNGVPFLKISRTHEVVSYGVCSLMTKFQNVPVAMFAWVTKAIIDDKTVYYPDIKVLEKDDDTALAILRTMEVMSIYVKPIKDFYSVPIGFLTVEYKETQKLSELTRQQITMILEASARIGLLLTDARNEKGKN